MQYFYRFCWILLLSAVGTFLIHRSLLSNLRKYFIEFSKNEQVFLTSVPNYDVVLLGSSRMFNTVNPRVLDSVLGCNSFNLGQSGAAMAEQTTNLRAYMATHQPPRMVCVALDIHMLRSKNNFTFTPYYITSSKNIEIEKALQEDGLKTRVYQIIPFLTITEYGDYFKSAFLKNALHKSALGPNDFYYKGYISNTLDTISLASNAPMASLPKPQPITGKGKGALVDMIALCRQHNIQLVCTYSPEYKAIHLNNATNRDEVFGFYDSLLTANHIPFLRHHALPICHDHRLFANIGHVNKIGADVYSAILARELKPYYNRRRTSTE